MRNRSSKATRVGTTSSLTSRRLRLQQLLHMQPVMLGRQQHAPEIRRTDCPPPAPFDLSFVPFFETCVSLFSVAPVVGTGSRPFTS